MSSSAIMYGSTRLDTLHDKWKEDLGRINPYNTARDVGADPWACRYS